MASYFITGTSRGIGLQLAASLASQPPSDIAYVFAAARKQSDDLRKLVEGANGRVQFVPLELTSKQSAEEAARLVEKALNGQGLDYLINSAAIMNKTPKGVTEITELSEHLNTNVVGANNVIIALLPLIRKGNSKKVINITTTMASLSMSSYFTTNLSHAYKISKTALNMLTVQYSEILRDEGVTVVAVCPGARLPSYALSTQLYRTDNSFTYVKTDMGGEGADLTPDQSASGILEIAHGIDIKDTGKFLTIRVPGWETSEQGYNGSSRPW